MADWDSADLLRRWEEEVGLASANDLDDAAYSYPLLADAQEEVIRLIAARYPKCLYQEPTALTAVSGRKTFTFGTDAGTNPILPIGGVELASSLSAFTGDSSVLWVEGQDFIDEGTQIRIPGNRSYAGTIYGRWVTKPARISSSQAPSLKPADARVMIVNRAARKYAGQGGINPTLADAMDREWKTMFPEWMLTLKRRYRGGGALADSRWYLASADLSG